MGDEVEHAGADCASEGLSRLSIGFKGHIRERNAN